MKLFIVLINIFNFYKNNSFSSVCCEVTLINISFSDDCREILLAPLLGGHVLLKYHHLLEIHFLKLLRIFEYNSCQDVQTKSKVIILICDISIE